MGVVTGLATIHSHWRVLENEWPALIHVALQAGRLAAGRLLRHTRPLRHAPGGRECAMRVVAVRTLHEALIHTMLGRHLELGADGGVARVTKLALFLGQQKLRCGRMVDGVATGAGHVVLRVLRTPDIGPAEIAGVTAQAIFQHLFRLHQRERVGDGGLAAAGLYVRFGPAVAALATGPFRRFFAGGDALEVRIFVKIKPDVGVARLAGIAPNETR